MEEASQELEEMEIRLCSWTTLESLIPLGRVTAALSERWTATSFVTTQASTLYVARHVKHSDQSIVIYSQWLLNDFLGYIGEWATEIARVPGLKQKEQ